MSTRRSPAIFSGNRITYCEWAAEFHGARVCTSQDQLLQLVDCSAGLRLGGLDYCSGPDDSRGDVGTLRLLDHGSGLDWVWIDLAQSTSTRKMNPFGR